MSSQPQSGPSSSQSQKTSLLDNAIVQQVVEKYGPQVLSALVGLFLSLFKKKPKDPVLVTTQPGSPVPAPGVPTPIPAPSASTPTPGQVARRIASVVLTLQKAERPDLSTPDRRQSPGDLYPNPMAMISAGENFHYGSAFWFDLTAYDENGDEWTGDSIIAADKEFKTEHRIMNEGSSILAYIKGEGDQNPTGLGEPKDWHQMNGDEIHWAQRAWKDSVGRNARVRIGREGTFKVKGAVDGVWSNELVVKVS